MKFFKKALSLLQRKEFTEIAVYAGNTSFFLLMSALPLLTLVLGILSVTSFGVQELSLLLLELAPEALWQTLGVFLDSLREIRPTAVISVSAIIALWSASRGIMSLMIGFQSVLGLPDRRSFLKRQLICILCTLVLAAALIVTLALLVWGQTLLSVLRADSFFASDFLSRLLTDLRWPAALLLTAIFTLLYLLLPDWRESFLHVLPGGLAAAGAWLLFSRLYSCYVTYATARISVYGSLTLLLMSLLWLYISIQLLFYGLLLIRLLARRRKNQT